MAVTLTVDPELCIGSGDCVRVVPAAFEIDDASGVSVPLPGAGASEVETLLRAARGCPTQAIRIVGEDGSVLHAGN